MALYTDQIAVWGTEISANATTFNGTFQAFSSTFLGFPRVISIYNGTNVTVSISQDGTNTNLTLPAGGYISLNLQANRGIANNFSFPKGSQWYVKGSSGTGIFVIDYLYGKTNNI